MSRPDADVYQPRRPALLAWAVFMLAALTLCWPKLTGQFLLGDDQYVAGYAFRKFGAEAFRATGSIPEWNPYLFGGLPFIAAQHGDVFYPTAWLRWILPVDAAMNLGFALHIVLAGGTMYALTRALRTSWSGAVLAGIAYEMSGIVASLVRPGHDGKLFVSALAPLGFLALVRAIRDRRPWGYALLSGIVGLCMLSPHYQMTYYLLVALALWTLWLVFLDPERPQNARAVVTLACSLGAVLLGLGIAAIQVLPFLAYLPFSPRAEGGPSGGWAYATGFSMPPEEIVTTVLPQFNGMLDHYWGRNFFKLHTEYLGAVAVVLAAFGLTDRARRPLAKALGAILILFLLVAFGGHTPFYRLWYEVMPMMKKVRAPGMAFFLVALPVAVFAGFGTDRLLRGEGSRRGLTVGFGALGALALLGVVGALESVAIAFAGSEQVTRAMENGGALRGGALRLLVVALVGGAVTWAIWSRKLTGAVAGAALMTIVVLDFWSIDRNFFEFKGPASEVYRDDAITTRLRQERGAFRVLDAGVYQGSYLMAHDIRTMLGYHGNEVRFYDELLGGKNEWTNAGNPNLLDLLSVRFLLLPGEQEVPSFRKILGPVVTTPGSTGVLYERDTIPPYVRVLSAAAKLTEAQLVPTVIDPKFPRDAVVVYPDTASLTPGPIRGEVRREQRVRPTLADWSPGRMRVSLTGTAGEPTYLLVSETWYPDWRATVDGRPAQVVRADHALLSVMLPPGAKEVLLTFHSDAYARGKLVTLLAGLSTLALTVGPAIMTRRAVRA